jgi:Fe-S cluster assembly scaffold protein SufB
MLPEKLFLVMGEADELEWPVAWYVDVEYAKLHASKAIERAEILWKQYQGKGIPTGANEFDAYMYSETEPSHYYVMEVKRGVLSDQTYQLEHCKES